MIATKSYWIYLVSRNWGIFWERITSILRKKILVISDILCYCRSEYSKECACIQKWTGWYFIPLFGRYKIKNRRRLVLRILYFCQNKNWKLFYVIFLLILDMSLQLWCSLINEWRILKYFSIWYFRSSLAIYYSILLENLVAGTKKVVSTTASAKSSKQLEAWNTSVKTLYSLIEPLKLFMSTLIFVSCLKVSTFFTGLSVHVFEKFLLHLSSYYFDVFKKYCNLGWLSMHHLSSQFLPIMKIFLLWQCVHLIQ